MNRRAIRVVVACGMLAAPWVSVNARAQGPAVPPEVSSFVEKWDRSGKGMLDIKAVLNAAIVKFGMLDQEHKGRLTAQQLSSVLTAEEFAQANPDGDKTMGAVEWFDLVQERFQAANPDNDGSLTADELVTSNGKALLKLLQ